MSLRTQDFDAAAGSQAFCGGQYVEWEKTRTGRAASGVPSRDSASSLCQTAGQRGPKQEQMRVRGEP